MPRWIEPAARGRTEVTDDISATFPEAREDTCPFCQRLAAEVPIVAAGTAAAIADAYPVSPGHTLVVPRRHEPDFLRLSAAEQTDIWSLTAALCDWLRSERGATSFNLGVNVGRQAGQTINHAHLHVIPRYDGDIEDPRGGVRWVIPRLAAYWETP
jgi:diadenosine tetraphosphate (Ap4A) HIT family hydrolase